MPLLSDTAREALRSDIKQSIRLHAGYDREPVRFAISNEPHSLWLTSHPDALYRVQRHGAMGTIPQDLPAAQVNDQTLIMGPRSPLFHQLGAKEFRPTAIPNLYAAPGLPEMHPQALQGLMADRPGQVVGIEPHEAGGFAVRSLPQSAFKPVSALLKPSGGVHKPLATRPFQSPFALLPFHVADEAPPPEPNPSRRKGKIDPEQAIPEPTPQTQQEQPKKVTSLKTKLASAKKVVAGKLEQQKAALEEHFKSLGGLLDSPERQALLPQIATVNEQLGHKPEAATAWLNAMWHNPQGEADMASKWLHAEDPNASPTPTQDEFDKDLSIATPTPSDVRRVAARVVQSNLTGGAGLANRRLAVGEYLQRHEDLLGTRAAWEAWSHLSHGDTLALARARDRLLNRLLNSGHRELDFPNFLRFGTGADSQHMSTVRSQMGPLQAAINKWHAGPESKVNEPYKNLSLAFMAASLGDHATARNLMEQSGRSLLQPMPNGQANLVHDALYSAYKHRIESVISGKPHGHDFPDDVAGKFSDLADKREHGSRPLQYVANRLRQYSWILDPHKTINASAKVLMNSSNVPRNDSYAPARAAALSNITDHAVLRSEIEKFLYVSTDPHNKAVAVDNFLPLAARVGEDFTTQLINQVPSILSSLRSASGGVGQINSTDGGSLIGRAIFYAAHFDRKELIKPLLDSFNAYLAKLPIDEKAIAISDISTNAVNGLKKVGMSDQLKDFLDKSLSSITNGKSIGQLRSESGSQWPNLISALTGIAHGMRSLGDTRNSEPILDSALDTIKDNKLNLRAYAYASLIEKYIAAVSEGPINDSINKMIGLYNSIKLGPSSDEASSYFDLKRQRIIEATIRHLVGEKHGLDEQGKKWSDEDEYLVRRRIHQDMREALSKDANVSAELPTNAPKPQRGEFALPERR